MVTVELEVSFSDSLLWLTLLRRHEGRGTSMFDLSPGVASCGHVVCSGYLLSYVQTASKIGSRPPNNPHY